MKRSLTLTLLAIACACVCAQPSPAAPNVCHENCIKCADACDEAAKLLSSKKAGAALVKQLRACAKTCRTYNGTGTKAQEKACAEVCKVCLAACEKNGDPGLKECISQCKQCADCCSK